ncbi:MAG: exopolyphosphatase [Chitinophagaceae bacterium]|nr:exopolyphosphatase [Chitinophagaceae bacterium]HQV05235.1 exopolyphosphatase [Chitinophagaceae bacterium]
MKLAAIDIGSNAVRLLINDAIKNAQGEVVFNKVGLFRVPLRLGFDVFDKGKISITKTKKLIATMQAFHLLLDVYEVNYLKVCATSAMRDARNASEVLKKVKKETGIKINVISGNDEASFIYENHIAETLTPDHAYLYVDVGGGSTELTFFSQQKLVFKKSFNIGTIRLLKNQVTENKWMKMQEYLKTHTQKYQPVTAIGSGGNINKLYSISKKKEGQALSLLMLKNYYKKFDALTIAERMQTFKLRADRADVIVPALSIYIKVLEWTSAQQIFVPKIGLADGLIHSLYHEITNP